MRKRLALLLALSMLAACALSACSPAAPQNTKPSSTPGKTDPAPAATSPTTQPAQPTVPTQPAEPTHPEDPQPSQPTEPTQPSEPEKPTEPTQPTEPEKPDVPAELPQTNVFLVGDSTVCAFSDQYYLPRYGYGTQLGQFLTEKATVRNLALSGRSSRSFLSEQNYRTLCSELKAGDYLLIAFGHNDQKSDDAARFTDASKPYTEEGSFGYHLYEYYIKPALDAGAMPILCTPIVRVATDDDYSGAEAHVTATGDYRQAILDLGKAVNVPVVDLTAITRERYAQIGAQEAMQYHAVISGQYDADGVTVVPNMATVDKTHLNIYGAKYIAYRLACQLQQLECIKGYVAETLTEPTVAELVPNPNYVITDYTAPDLDNYTAPSHFATLSDGWYGTAFGDTGGNPQSAGNGFTATETEEGVFLVGQSAGSNKGKFSSSSDGFAFAFRQVEADQNFCITVTATIVKTASTKQAGFGLMLRDDVLIDQNSNGTISSNYVTAGVLANSDSQMFLLFSRENEKLNKGDQSLSPLYAEGDTFTLTIERIGQSVTVTVEYNGQAYSKTYYDFDFFARDMEYMYIGMFANRGTVVEYTDITYTELGDSMGA